MIPRTIIPFTFFHLDRLEKIPFIDIQVLFNAVLYYEDITIYGFAIRRFSTIIVEFYHITSIR